MGYVRKTTMSICLIFKALSICAEPTSSVMSIVADQAKKTNPLYGYMVGPGTPRLDRPVLRPFSTDGCSLSPDSILGKQIVHCCVVHDVAYWIGGTMEDKNISDKEFEECIVKRADPISARIYREAVSVGGNPIAPNTFRWGYGWDRIRPAGPLTAEEIKQGEDLYGPNLISLKQMVAAEKYKVNLELLTLDFAQANRFSDDVIVYYFLQNTLKRKDIITYGQKMKITSKELSYVIGLQGCGTNRIKINLNRSRLLKDFFKLRKNQHRVPWSELKTYIKSVDDPGQCLQ